jgi:hypothetical protein
MRTNVKSTSAAMKAELLSKMSEKEFSSTMKALLFMMNNMNKLEALEAEAEEIVADTIAPKRVAKVSYKEALANATSDEEKEAIYNKEFKRWVKTNPERRADFNYGTQAQKDEQSAWLKTEPKRPTYSVAYQIKKYDEIGLFDSNDEIDRKYADREAFIARITKEVA